MVDLVELYVTGSLEIPDHETGGMLPTVGAYRLFVVNRTFHNTRIVPGNSP